MSWTLLTCVHCDAEVKEIRWCCVRVCVGRGAFEHWLRLLVCAYVLMRKCYITDPFSGKMLQAVSASHAPVHASVLFTTGMAVMSICTKTTRANEKSSKGRRRLRLCKAQMCAAAAKHWKIFTHARTCTMHRTKLSFCTAQMCARILHLHVSAGVETNVQGVWGYWPAEGARGIRESPSITTHITHANMQTKTHTCIHSNTDRTWFLRLHECVPFPCFACRRGSRNSRNVSGPPSITTHITHANLKQKAHMHSCECGIYLFSLQKGLEEFAKCERFAIRHEIHFTGHAPHRAAHLRTHRTRLSVNSILKMNIN